MPRSGRSGTAIAPKAAIGELPDWLRSGHAAVLGRATAEAHQAAVRSGKAWQLEADKATRAILERAGAPEAKSLSARTEHAYRRAYATMLAAGHTPSDHATSVQHFNFLRSAWRFCEAEQIVTLRRASDAARKAKDLPSAQRRTERAHARAVIFEAMFLAEGHPTWADKAKALKATGKKPVKNSKRFGPRAPSADALVLMLGADEKGAARHGVRATVLSTFGMRPGELENPAGVRLNVEKDAKGNRILTCQVHGAKVCHEPGHERGQEVRLLSIPVPKPARGQGIAANWLASLVEDGGKPYILTSTNADIRSLNRLFARLQDGLSCYSFRHAVGSDLKASDMSASERAAFMGHRSTESLSSYGRRRHGKGKRFRAKGSDPVRAKAQTRDARVKAREDKRSRKKTGRAVVSRPAATQPKAKPPTAAVPKPSTPRL